MSVNAPALTATAPLQASKVCALIDGPDPDGDGAAAILLAENLLRLRRQLDDLSISEVFGLGDIPAGATFLVLRADMIFAFSALSALARAPGCGAHFEDTLAAVHVEAGDAAAALAKFRRQETTGWQPFHIRFFRLGHFRTQTLTQRLLSPFGKRGKGTIAKAALLRTDPHAADEDQPIREIWRALPGLDRFVRSLHAMEVQLLLRDALGLKPTGWRGIGFLLILVMLSFGAFGWTWFGAVIALFAAGAFDLAQRASALEDLRLSSRSSDICTQALVISCLWLFAVFAAGQGATAKMPALVLIAMPAAFIAAQASRRLLPHAAFEDMPFGLYLQALLVCAVVAALPLPLLSIFFSVLGLAGFLALIVSVAVRLGRKGFDQKSKGPAALIAHQPAE
ncbi:MAG: hypothetical protein AAF221_03735 [Pseudomonadota bacterium]